VLPRHAHKRADGQRPNSAQMLFVGFALSSTGRFSDQAAEISQIPPLQLTKECQNVLRPIAEDGVRVGLETTVLDTDRRNVYVFFHTAVKRE